MHSSTYPTLSQLGKKEKQLTTLSEKHVRKAQELDEQKKAEKLLSEELLRLTETNRKLVEENKNLTEEGTNHVELVRNMLLNEEEGGRNHQEAEVQQQSQIEEMKVELKQKDKEITNLKERNASLQSLTAEGEKNINLLEDKVAELTGQLKREKDMNDVLEQCRTVLTDNRDSASTPTKNVQSQHEFSHDESAEKNSRSVEDGDSSSVIGEYENVDVTGFESPVTAEEQAVNKSLATNHGMETPRRVMTQIEKGPCPQAFLEGKHICPDSCHNDHDLDFEKIKRGTCLFEFAEKKSCKRGDTC